MNFFYGVIFIILIYPMLESLAAIIIQLSELIKGLISIQITKINLKIKSLQEDNDDFITTKKNPIGFSLNDIKENEEVTSEEDL